MPHHILSHQNRKVVFSIVHHEPNSTHDKYVANRQERYRRTHPTKLGNIVQALAFVLMAVFVASASLRLGNATK